jgi:hypothetical protein
VSFLLLRKDSLRFRLPLMHRLMAGPSIRLKLRRVTFRLFLPTFVSVGIKVSSASFQNRVCNGSQVDQGLAGKAQQEPEGEMEETETSGAAEAPI